MFGRLFWLIMMIGAMMMFILGLQNLISEAFQPPNFVSTVSVVDEEPMLFPYVVICNLNRLNWTLVGDI
jgi:hypothetical protein